MKKKKKYGKYLLRVLAIVYCLIYFLFVGMVFYFNVVPDKYLWPVLLVVTLFSIIVECFIWHPKIKKIWKRIAIVIAFLLMIIYVVGIYYMVVTIRFMQKLDDVKTQETEYYVIVHKDSEIQKKSQLSKQSMKMLESKSELDQKAVKELKNKYQTKMDIVDNINELEQSIKEQELVFMSRTLYTMMSEKPYQIDDDTKIIDKIKVYKKIDEIKKKTNSLDEPFHIYISGTDSAGTISDMARSDVNMIVTVNPKTNQILLTSIPRDYYVTLHTSGVKDKLTHAGVYGLSESIMTIQDLLEIEIPYYVHVNFTTLIQLVDAIGGIDVVSDTTFQTHGMGVKYTFYAGVNHLDGKRALAFSRERKSFADGDKKRVQNQQKVLEAILNKAMSSTSILTNYTQILNTLQSSFQTNFTQQDMTYFIKKQLNDMKPWSITMIHLDGTSSYQNTYTYGSQKLYVMLPDMNSILQAKENIKQVTKE